MWTVPCARADGRSRGRGFSGKVKVGKMDVDSNPGVAGQYGIRSIPTILLFKGGENVGQLVGNVSKNAIEEMISAAI